MSKPDEATYLRLADATFRKVLDAFEKVDPDDVDAFQSTSDVVTLACRDGVRCVLNTQRPLRQLWLAAGANAWHFDYDAGTSRWIDDKGGAVELFACLRSIVKKHGGVELDL